MAGGSKKNRGAFKSDILKALPPGPGRDFERGVARFARERDMFAPHDRVLAGLSGGPDSSAMLRALLEIADLFQISVGAAHMNHLIRGEEAERDAAFAAALAEKAGIEFHPGRKDVKALSRKTGLSIQEAARQARGRFLDDTARKAGYDKIALAHHMDDNAELVLMYILRGSGTLGISGMAPVRENRVVRPLMGVFKSDIWRYIREKKLEYVTDSSNRDTKYMRNRIRKDLIPRIQSFYNPRASETLNRLSTIARQEEAWMEEMIRPVFAGLVLSESPDAIRMDAPGIRRLHTAAQRRVIRKALARLKGDLRRITLAHVDAVIGLLFKDGKTRQLHLPGRIRAVRKKDALFFVAEKIPLRRTGPP